MDTQGRDDQAAASAVFQDQPEYFQLLDGLSHPEGFVQRRAGRRGMPRLRRLFRGARG